LGSVLARPKGDDELIDNRQDRPDRLHEAITELLGIAQKREPTDFHAAQPMNRCRRNQGLAVSASGHGRLRAPPLTGFLLLFAVDLVTFHACKMTSLPISVCMISGAEASRIGRALDSVAGWTSETNVVLNQDVGDGTDKIALSAGARVFREPWKGHI